MKFLAGASLFFVCVKNTITSEYKIVPVNSYHAATWMHAFPNGHKPNLKVKKMKKIVPEWICHCHATEKY